MDDPRIGDEDLLAAARAGDRAAFERLYERHAPRMKSIAANLLSSASDAEDAVQESFLKVYRGAEGFRSQARLGTWIYRILLRTCYDALRRRRRRPDTAASPSLPDDPVALRAAEPDHQLRLELEDAVSRLPERARTVFLLSAVEGFVHREIGEVLGIPEATSRTLLFEARRELQRLLWKEERV